MIHTISGPLILASLRFEAPSTLLLRLYSQKIFLTPLSLLISPFPPVPPAAPLIALETAPPMTWERVKFRRE